MTHTEQAPVFTHTIYTLATRDDGADARGLIEFQPAYDVADDPVIDFDIKLWDGKYEHMQFHLSLPRVRALIDALRDCVTDIESQL